MAAILERITRGSGERGDIDLLLEISEKITGKTLCALGESAASMVKSFIVNFRNEFEEKLSHRPVLFSRTGQPS